MLTNIEHEQIYQTILNDKKAHAMSTVVKEIYKRNMDNRILNNLRMQVNESVKKGDSRAIIPFEVFKTLWYTFFKGEKDASIIFDMILPHVSLIDDGDHLHELDE
jgi:hypothetical protein